MAEFAANSTVPSNSEVRSQSRYVFSDKKLNQASHTDSTFYLVEKLFQHDSRLPRSVKWIDGPHPNTRLLTRAGEESTASQF